MKIAILGRIACTAYMRPMSTDARSVVCMSVCLSVWHTDEPCKTAKSIETPLGEQTRVGPKNHILNGGLH